MFCWSYSSACGLYVTLLTFVTEALLNSFSITTSADIFFPCKGWQVGSECSSIWKWDVMHSRNDRENWSYNWVDFFFDFPCNITSGIVLSVHGFVCPSGLWFQLLSNLVMRNCEVERRDQVRQSHICRTRAVFGQPLLFPCRIKEKISHDIFCYQKTLQSGCKITGSNVTFYGKTRGRWKFLKLYERFLREVSDFFRVFNHSVNALLLQ